MRNVIKPLILIIVCAGCSRFEGPLEVRRKQRADAPGYTIPEQRKRALERNPFIDDDPRKYPDAHVSRPDPIGR